MKFAVKLELHCTTDAMQFISVYEVNCWGYEFIGRTCLSLARSLECSIVCTNIVCFDAVFLT